jgi:hypothetical protein
MTGLCPGCAHVRFIESATGSRFLMCRLAKEDVRFSKYPPQPVLRCAGFEDALPSKESRT